ncbi:aspartate/methionine/tyrosine aminotransferase [Bifidobacterium commune]|uniref:Aspartate/methionine/tyrosine aminotransferase n=1 Tax=Bifidobacterium commune TaxID=1505727 RepID=A0A1C4H109_9BIFI|nr:pyridoxal phosphate-dependent aminotransferase [Bifidobacterium commune]MBB2954713.1 aspartate/methionine/tyrosine aminotransferase [Bifidobacterium commune]SCC78615.1 Aspartate/methionine/tyrosine aminotransferase [Bifidobacterium commune]
MRFSTRVGSTRLNPIAAAEAQVQDQGILLPNVNDSNPTRHGLAPKLVPRVYTADPRGPLAARQNLAKFLTDRNERESLMFESRQSDIEKPAVRLGKVHTTSVNDSEGGSQDVQEFGDATLRVNPDSLYLLSSTSQAYSWLFKLMCDPGDIVLGPKPGYPLIESIGRLENVETVEYQLRFDGSWFIDVAWLAEFLRSEQGQNARAIVLINPNNPTGSYIKPDERIQLAGLCREHGLAIIADEVFFDYSLEPFPGNRRLAGQRTALTFALDGFSKLLAAPHAKVGWIQVSGPDDLVAQAQRRLDIIADNYLPFSDIIAAAMPQLLAAVPEQLNVVKRRTQANLNALHCLLDADKDGLVSVLRAEGGWNVLLRFPSVVDENALVLRLIEDFGLTGQPGYYFDMTDNGYLAVSLLPKKETFERNIRAILATVPRELEEF